MKPALLIVDDDPQVLQAVGIDLRHKYGDRFRVLKADFRRNCSRHTKTIETTKRAA